MKAIPNLYMYIWHLSCNFLKNFSANCKYNLFDSLNVKIYINKINQNMIKKSNVPAYSGARYPKVPVILVSIEPLTSGASRTRPKSATLALISSPRRILEGFKSLCIKL